VAGDLNVWAYTVLRNEAALLPYWLRHYQSFCARVVVYDDESTDGSAGIARAAGAEVRPCPVAGLDDAALAEFASGQYREARGAADWVIWADADEFVYHPLPRMLLGRLKASGVTLPQVAGYAMVAQSPPSGPGQIWQELGRGAREPRLDKPCVLDPGIDIAWGPGRHYLASGHETTTPSARAELKLLHYRHLGRDYFAGRNARNYARLPAESRAAGLGWETYPEHQGTRGWEADLARLGEIGVVV
jgi:glycosyltransferase involved in cell wall biosynthesis